MSAPPVLGDRSSSRGSRRCSGWPASQLPQSVATIRCRNPLPQSFATIVCNTERVADRQWVVNGKYLVILYLGGEPGGECITCCSNAAQRGNWSAPDPKLDLFPSVW